MARHRISIRLRVLTALTLLLLLSTVLFVPIASAQETVTVDIDIQSATVDQLGVVTVSGVVICAGPVAFVDVSVSVRQPIGRFRTISGSGFTNLGPCEGTVPFSLSVVADTGQFKPGTAYINAFAFGCDEFFFICDSGQDFLALRLRRS